MAYEKDNRRVGDSHNRSRGRSHTSRRQGKRSGNMNLPGILITALFVLMEGWFFFRLVRLNFLPAKYMWLIAAGLLLLTGIVGVLCWNARKKTQFALGTLLAALLSVGMIFGTGIVDKVRSTVQQLTPPTTDVHQTVQMGIYALTGGNIQAIADLEGKTLGIMETVDREEAEQVLDEISRKLNSPLQVKAFTSFAEVVQALYDDDIQAAILEENFLSVLSSISGFSDVAQRVHKVSEYRAERPTVPVAIPGESAATTAADPTDSTRSSRSWTIVKDKTRPGIETDPTEATSLTEEITQTQATPAPTTQPPEGPVGTAPPPTQAPVAWNIDVPAGQEGRVFTVYISGLDTRGGGLADRGNSDVNILAAVNMNTKQILLINTPRDYYVAFPTVGGTDKLTHAGYYGVHASMAALRNLYGVSPQYYVRLGFDGLKAFINALGGVNVYSAYTFDERGYSFTQGNNAMDGDKALIFARARYTVPGGDRGRGQNQMALVRAMMQKLSSLSTWSNFNQILDSLGGLISTTIPYDTIAAFSQSVLNGDGWNVASYSVDGSNGMTYSFSIGTSAFVIYPNYGTVSYAQSLVRRLYNGEYVSP